jgi:putative hemolysin
VTVLWLLLLAFFAGGEIMVLALDPLRLETESAAGSRSARILRRLRLDPQRFLTSMLIGNNVASMSLAAYFTSQSITLLGGPGGLSIESATLFSAVTMIVVQTLFGELIPKTLAAVSGQRLSQRLALPLLWTQHLFTPFSWLLESAIRPLIRLLSGGRTGMGEQLGLADLETALQMAHRSGQLHKTDAAVASEALDFSHTSLGEVMTPRVDVVAVEEGVTIGTALTVMTDSGFTRLPVYRDSLDEITGALLLKDLVQRSLRWAIGGRDAEDRWVAEPAAPHLRQVAHFPATKSIVEALAEIRQQRLHLAVVVDEHGGTAGIVTLEDILEELVGDIRDETDHDHSVDVVRRYDDHVIVTGRARLDQLPELAGLDLEGSETSTIGGLMMERLGRPAVVGDQIQLGGVLITALKVLRTRIKLLRLEPAPPPELSEPEL